MNSIQSLSVTYTSWKNMRTFLGGTVNSYYVQVPGGFLLVLVDLSRGFVTMSNISGGNSNNQSNLLDFQNNIQPTAILQPSLDDCISAAIIGK